MAPSARKGRQLSGTLFPIHKHKIPACLAGPGLADEGEEEKVQTMSLVAQEYTRSQWQVRPTLRVGKG